MDQKVERLKQISKFTDVILGKFQKAVAGSALDEYSESLIKLVNSAHAEIDTSLGMLNEVINFQIFKHLEEGQSLRYSSTQTAHISRIIDEWADLQINNLKFKSIDTVDPATGKTIKGKEYTDADIAAIHKAAGEDKARLASATAIDDMKNATRADADSGKASIKGVLNWKNSLAHRKDMASTKYKMALGKDNEIVFENGFVMIDNILESSLTKKNPFWGLQAGTAPAIARDKKLMQLFEPIIEKKLDKFYAGLVGQDIDGLVFNSADDVRMYFDDVFEQHGISGSYNKYKDIHTKKAHYDKEYKTLPSINFSLGIEDYSIIRQSLNQIYDTNDAGKLFADMAAGASGKSRVALMGAADNINSILNTLDNYTAKLGVTKAGKLRLQQLTEADAFYRNSVGPMFANENKYTGYIFSGRLRKVSEAFPTGIDHSLDKSPTQFMKIIWDDLIKDGPATEQTLLKSYGIYNRETDSFEYITDAMIKKAQQNKSGTFKGYSAEDLKYFKNLRDDLRYNLIDYYTATYADMLEKGVQKIHPGFVLKKSKNPITKEVTYNWDDLDKLIVKDKTSGNDTLTTLLAGLDKDFLTNAAKVEENAPKLFDIKRATILRRGLWNHSVATGKNRQTTQELAKARGLVDGELARLQKDTFPKIIRHKKIIGDVLSEIMGKKDINSLDFFTWFIESAPSTKRLDQLRKLLVEGKVDAEMYYRGADDRMRRVGTDYKLFTQKVSGVTMSAEEFDKVIGVIVANGLRRRATREISVSPDDSLWSGSPLDIKYKGQIKNIDPSKQEDVMEAIIDSDLLLNLVADNSEALRPYIDVGALRIIHHMGKLFDDVAIAGAKVLPSTFGAAKFTPASWISRFYAAQSGRTSLRYIGAEAVVAAMLRREGEVVQALLQSKAAQQEIAKMFVSNKLPMQDIQHANMAWIPDLAANVLYYANNGFEDDTFYRSVEKKEEPDPIDIQMKKYGF